MEFIPIGSVYSRGIRHDDGSAFDPLPSVVLYNLSTRRYYIAEVTAREEDSGCDFTFSAEVTSAMLPGVYNLEIYEDDSRENLLKRIVDYARAGKIAVSPNNTNSTPETSD